MSSIGRIIAGARDLSVGGPLGALLVRAARSLPSRLANRFGSPRPRDPKRSIAFTIAVIALGAKMAKADGTVSRDEVAAFREVFQVPPGEEAHLRLVFDLARRSTAGFDSYARQVGRLFAGHRAVLEDLLGGSVLYRAGRWPRVPGRGCLSARGRAPFGFRRGRLCPDPRGVCRQAGGGRRRWRSRGDDDPHAVLGLVPDASLDEIRAAYRRLIRAHHPDLLVARGMPAERVALATQRVARINAARDRLLRHRGGAAEAQPA